MKNKKVWIISAVALLLAAVIIAVIVFEKKSSNDTKPKEGKDVSSSTSVHINAPENSTADITSSNDEIIDNGTGLTQSEPEMNAPDNRTGEKSGAAAAPVKVKEPEEHVGQEGSGNGSGIIIGDGGSTQEYSCGTPNHHCSGPETHSFILNLEKEGCPYCGSHSCPSFYAADEWGNTRYTPSACPEYDLKKDPVHYCQTCGKECGDGTGGTCVQFINACNCPVCGEYVESLTCHSCK